MMRKFVLIAAILLLILPAIAFLMGNYILFYGKSIKGNVVDIDTKTPIEGAIVVSIWKLTQFPGGGPGGYAKVSDDLSEKGKSIL